MNEAKPILFFELCRLCLAEPGSTNVFGSTDLGQDIFLCAGVKVSPSDNLPHKICTKCFEIVTNAKDLRIRALKNDSDLRSLFEDNTSKRDESGKVEDIPSSSRTNDVTERFDFINKKQDKDTSSESDKHIKKLSFDDCSSCTPVKQIITVRKDIFESSATVTSSTKDTKENCTQVEKTSPTNWKRKKEDYEETEYECEICNKSFDKWKQLYLHQRLHNKTLSCPLDACLKKFSSKSDLEKHLGVHTGVRPYKCDLCDKSFTQNGTLKSHKENIHHVQVK